MFFIESYDIALEIRKIVQELFRLFLLYFIAYLVPFWSLKAAVLFIVTAWKGATSTFFQVSYFVSEESHTSLEWQVGE